MRSREDLHTLLESIPGLAKVYFKPPSNVKLEFPCVIYKRHTMNANYADNTKFHHSQSYQITLIYKDPDSQLPRILYDTLEFCTPNTPTYVSDGLYHDVFTVYW